jgi:hypothetical protein
VNAASELPDTPLPNDREVAYFKVDVEDRPSADLLSHMDFVADMIEEVRLLCPIITPHDNHPTKKFTKKLRCRAFHSAIPASLGYDTEPL